MTGKMGPRGVAWGQGLPFIGLTPASSPLESVLVLFSSAGWFPSFFVNLGYVCTVRVVDLKPSLQYMFTPNSTDAMKAN